MSGVVLCVLCWQREEGREGKQHVTGNCIDICSCVLMGRDVILAVVVVVLGTPFSVYVAGWQGKENWKKSHGSGNCQWVYMCFSEC